MDSTAWDSDVLAHLASAKEVDITPVDTEGTRRDARTIWSIGVDGALYVRSWKGRGAVWFRDILETGQGEVAVTGGGVSQRVTIEPVEVGDPVQAAISATFLTKYSDDGYAGAMNEDAPMSATLRLVPRA